MNWQKQWQIQAQLQMQHLKRRASSMSKLWLMKLWSRKWRSSVINWSSRGNLQNLRLITHQKTNCANSAKMIKSIWRQNQMPVVLMCQVLTTQNWFLLHQVLRWKWSIQKRKQNYFPSTRSSKTLESLNLFLGKMILLCLHHLRVTKSNSIIYDYWLCISKAGLLEHH